MIYFGARYYDPDTSRFITQDTYLGEPGKAPSLHRYLYAYSNPAIYVDPNGNAATPYFNAPIDDTTIQLPLFQTIDTGNQYADEALAAVASIPNLVFSLANAIPAGLNAPLKVASVVTDIPQNELSDELLATAASTGPAAPFLLLGESPMLPGMALNRVNRLFKGAKTLETVDEAAKETRVAAKLTDEYKTEKKADVSITSEREPSSGGNRANDGTVAEGGESAASSTEAAPVKPGDRGTYSELKERKRKHGQTEPVEMHEMPSYAAKKEAFYKQYGRYPSTSEEKKMVRDAGVSEAVKPEVHKKTRTYAGKNTKDQVAQDSQDLQAAQKLDEKDLENIKSSNE